MRVLACLFLVSLALVGCAGTARADAPFRLGPGDEVAVSVLPQKDYDCSGLILSDGMLYLKNIGGLKAAGMTIPELTERIRKVLDLDLVDPRVTVTLARPAPKEAPRPVKPGRITVVGAVGTTGPLDLEEGLRVRKALDLAGGTLKDADLAQIVILHRDLTRTTVDLSTDKRLSDPAHNRLLLDGDSIEVRLRAVRTVSPVRIAGQVQNPSQYDLKEGMTLEDLILAAGKLRPLADVERVELRRRGQAPKTVNLVEQRKLGLNGKVLLEGGDEVFIPEQKDVVILIGAIPLPGAKPLKPGHKIRDFFVMGAEDVAIGLNPALVDLAGVQLIRPGQAALRVNLSEVLKKPAAKDNFALSSGDVIFLPPRKGPRRTPLDYLQQVSPLGFLFGLF